MEIKNKKSFNRLVKSLTLEIAKEDLDEMTTTGNVDGYNTPFAFTGNSKKSKKKNKKISTNSTGYDVVNEVLEEKDLVQIKKLIRVVVCNIIRDIWLKRTAWNK